MDKTFYVSTPIYYVNDAPHIGHAYTTILADVLARYYRLLGVPTFFLTGTDEHGQKVQAAAEKAGMTSQEQADGTVVRFLDLWKKLEITNDDFIRTTEERHKTVVQKILQDLYDRDEIYRTEYDGWYCVGCERFFTEKDLVDGKCPEPGCGRDVDKISESNYFFRMSKYQDWLIKYIEDNPEFIQPDFRRNETLGFLRNELKDLCISRPKSRLAWGIELPFDSDYVTYVWFDALVNYISGAGYLSDDERFAKWWPISYQLIGKDILTTHTVYWPTMLKAMGVEMPKTIFAHGWWLVGESKMGKSLGNAVNPMDFADNYGVDAFRYFLMAEMVLGKDASFTEDAFIRRYNSELANDLGNLVSRVMKMISNYFDGVVPVSAEDGADEESLQASVLGAAETMTESIGVMRPDRGLEAVITGVRSVNKYLELRQPWTLAKQDKKDELGTVLYSAAEALRILSGLLYPVMPNKMTELRNAIGVGGSEPDVSRLSEWGVLTAGTALGDAVSLFPRIKEPEAEQATDPKKKTPEPEEDDKVDYDTFSKIKLRTAVVKEAEAVEGADKLLRLQIVLGDEERQIVAGIAQHYDAESIVGKTIIVVSNLKPAKIRGVESNGMLLAATGEGGELKLVTVDGDVPSGAAVR